MNLAQAIDLERVRYGLRSRLRDLAEETRIAPQPVDAARQRGERKHNPRAGQQGAVLRAMVARPRSWQTVAQIARAARLRPENARRALHVLRAQRYTELRKTFPAEWRLTDYGLKEARR